MASETDKRTIDVIINGQKANASLKEMDAAVAVLYQQFRKMSADDPGRAKLLADYNTLKQQTIGIRGELNQATQSTSLLKQGFANAFAIFTGGGLLSLVQNLWGVLTSAREEYAGSARITADLENTLRSTQNAAGLTADEIKRIGEERAKITLFDDDETNSAAAMLLTFTNIKKGVFEDALPAIQDIATKMGGDGPADLKGASIQVGKALNDPIKGITALTRVGVTFTEQQKEQITQMVKAGDTAGAQKLILAELNKEFGGSAEAARKAAGGMATLSMRWGEMKETVGEVVQGGLTQLSDFLGVILDKSQPLVDVFMEVGQELGVYYDKVMDLVRGLGLFSNEGDMAATIVNFLAEAVRFLLMPLRVAVQVVGALIDGFVLLYNKSELVRGVLGGLVAVVVTTFKTIKDDAIKYLGGVGDLLVGVFTLDVDKIKSGLQKTFDATSDVVFKSGMRNAKAFVDGYNSNKDDLIVRTAKSTSVSASETSRNGGLDATAGESGHVELSQKELDKLEKQREAAAKKAGAALDRADKARLDALKAQVAHEEKLEDARVLAISDKREREIAKINLDAKRKGDLLLGTEAEIAEQLLAINEERERKLQELSAKYQQQADDNARKAFEQRLVAEDELEAGREAAIQTQFEDLLISEAERDLLVYESKRTALEAKLALEESYAGKTSATYLKTQRELLKLEKDHNKEVVADTKRREEAKMQFALMGLNSAQAALQVTIDILSRDEEARKKNAALIKAFTAAKIIIDGVEEVAAIWKNSNSNPLNILVPGAGTALAIAQTALAAVRTGFALTQVKSQKFAGGGATGGGMAANSSAVMEMSGMRVGSNGKLMDETGFAVAGIVHENEYVIPAWMRQDPKVIAVENWLEAKRLRGYAEGGATSDGGRQADPSLISDVSPLEQGEVTTLLREMLTEQRQQNARMDKWQSELKVVLSLRRFEEAQDLLKQVEMDSKIS